jgi:hypothetical protein
MASKIWIELEKPTSLEHAEEQCKLANKMLKRLGLETTEFWVGLGPGRPVYNITLNDSGEFMECSDNGQWFNLNRLAGE